jgi:hypothetical protein
MVLLVLVALNAATVILAALVSRSNRALLTGSLAVVVMAAVMLSAMPGTLA